MASGRPFGLCAWGSKVILSHVRHSKFSPDGEGTSVPPPQKGQRSPDLTVGDSACSPMPGMLAHPSPAGTQSPNRDSWVMRVLDLGRNKPDNPFRVSGCGPRPRLGTSPCWQLAHCRQGCLLWWARPHRRWDGPTHGFIPASWRRAQRQGILSGFPDRFFSPPPVRSCPARCRALTVSW